jgi:hypothetical protein
MIDRRLAWLLVVATTGCMRIYPDPELPDVVVEWLPECDDGGVTVRLEAVAADGTVVSQDVPCGEGTGRVEDLARTRHHVSGALLDASGEVLGRTTPEEVDLTEGHSVRTYVSYFARDHSFFRLAWTFRGGDTCASLAATSVVLDFEAGDGGESSVSHAGWCAAGATEYLPSVLGGTYAVRAFALRDDGTAVAVSGTREGVEIPDRGAVAELGTVELTRCDPRCDWPPQQPDEPDEPPPLE